MTSRFFTFFTHLTRGREASPPPDRLREHQSKHQPAHRLTVAAWPQRFLSFLSARACRGCFVRNVSPRGEALFFWVFCGTHERARGPSAEQFINFLNAVTRMSRVSAAGEFLHFLHAPPAWARCGRLCRKTLRGNCSGRLQRGREDLLRSAPWSSCAPVVSPGLEARGLRRSRRLLPRSQSSSVRFAPRGVARPAR